MATLNELHQDHQKWLKHLDFFQDEVKFFQNRLFSSVLENDHSPMTEEHIAEYRELFFLHLKRIDDIRHLILRHEHMISKEGRENFDSNHDHAHIEGQIKQFDEAFMELRKRFKGFASHHI